MPELDAIRGLAAVAVMEYHLLTSGSPIPGWIGRALRVAFGAGWVGVDVFFVLSGFLITGILLDARPKAGYYRDFYIRRAFRILPVYYGSALLAILAVVGLGLDISWPGVGCALAFLANVPIPNAAPFGPYWSLAVEEHFYFAWPWVVRRASSRALVTLCVSGLLAMPVLRALFWRHEFIYSLTPFRLDGLLLGALIAQLWRARGGVTARRAVLAAVGLGGTGLCLGALLLVRHATSRTTMLGAALQFTAIDLFVAGGFVLVLVLARNVTSRRGLLVPLGWLGDVSFSVYLNHMLALVVFDVAAARVGLGTGAGAMLLRAAVVNAAVLGAAAWSRRVVELPLIPVRNRVLAAAETSAAGAAVPVAE